MKVNKESDATINPNEIINKQKQERHLELVAKLLEEVISMVI